MGTLNLIPTRSTASEICTGCESSRRTVQDGPMRRSIWCLCVITKISTRHPSTGSPGPPAARPCPLPAPGRPVSLLYCDKCMGRKGRRRKSGTVRLARHTCIFSPAESRALQLLVLDWQGSSITQFRSCQPPPGYPITAAPPFDIPYFIMSQCFQLKRLLSHIPPPSL